MRILRVLALLMFAAVAAAQPPADTVNLITNGSTTSAQKLWPGGLGDFSCVGTWNGATVTLQAVGPDGSSLLTLGANTTLSSANPNPGGFMWHRALIQATVSGAGGSTSLTCSAVVIRTLVQ